jgi:hypothetical protein
MTRGSAWMSGEENVKGTIAPGQYADLVILPQDYFTMPAAGIRNLEAAATIVNGKVVYGSGPFERYAPPAPPVLPEWSPVKAYGGYQNK